MIDEEIAKLTIWRFNLEQNIDILEHPTHPTFCETQPSHPNNIVLIVGESFSKNHSSLYGYPRNTNPELQKLQNEGTLYVFDDIISPAASTTKAFKYFMTTLNLKDSEEERWYNHHNIIESFKTLGYRMTWYSTQQEKGFFNNLPSSFSKLCDVVTFIEESNYDDCLISLPLPDDTCQNFVIYHLMGQHENFSSRYPKEYNRFENKTRNDGRNTIIDEYDNATLFNDYVVSSIIRKYEDRNSLIIYFSDHGLDLFDTDESYFGHANATEDSQRHCMDVPFMVYVSSKLCASDSLFRQKISSDKQKPFNTENLIYRLLDYSGYSLTN